MLIEREAAIAMIEQKQKELCPVGMFSRNAVYGTDRDRFDAWDEIIDQIDALPTIDPIRAAGGCRCGECKKHMTPECLLCSFDVDGSCTGGPESDFYCGDSELEEARDMGKCVDRGYIPYAEITICDGCFHKDVCGDRDYLTENKCSARAGGCRCGECRHRDTTACPAYDAPMGRTSLRVKHCSEGEAREVQDDG